MWSPATAIPKTNVALLREDGIICKAYQGNQGADSIRELRKQTEDLVHLLRSGNKNVLILVDLSGLGKTTLPARKEEIAFIRSLDFDKAAVFGGNFLNTSLAKLIVNLSGMGYKIKFFNSEAEADRWLRNGVAYEYSQFVRESTGQLG